MIARCCLGAGGRNLGTGSKGAPGGALEPAVPADARCASDLLVTITPALPVFEGGHPVTVKRMRMRIHAEKCVCKIALVTHYCEVSFQR